MKDYDAKDIRNVVLLGHAGSGKTTLAEASLLLSKAIDRMGKGQDGSSYLDYDQEEAKRNQSVFVSLAPTEWNNKKINFIDTPGYLDYEGEKVSGIFAGDTSIVVVSGKDGIESGTENAVKQCKKYRKATIFFVNKMDDENAKKDKILTDLQNEFGSGCVPFVNDDGKLVIADKSTDAYKQLAEAIATADESLMDRFFEDEGASFTDEELKNGLGKAMTEGSVKPVFFGTATKQEGVKELLDFIVTYVNAYTELGEKHGKDLAGNPVNLKRDNSEAFSGQVFKTVVDPFAGKISYLKVLSGSINAQTPLYNPKKDVDEKTGGLFILSGKQQIQTTKASCGDIVALTKLAQTETNDTLCTHDKVVVYPDIEYPRPMLGLAISPKTKDDEDKMSDALKKVLIEDKSLNFVRNGETGEQVLYAVGDQQFDVVSSKLKNRYKVEIVTKEPKVQYRETIKGKSEVQGKYKKQNGGAGQYGDVWVRFEPNPDSEEMVFAEEVFGGSVPKNFFPSVEAGLRACMAAGPLAGCKVVNVKATLYDGSYHPVDSKPNSFEAAARLAFKAGIPQAKPILLEPIGKVTVICPETYTGDIIGDFNKRRGMIMDTGSTADGDAKIDAEVPMAEMMKYATELRSMTKGRGTYVIDFDRYEPAPQAVTDKVVAATAANRKDEDED